MMNYRIEGTLSQRNLIEMAVNTCHEIAQGNLLSVMNVMTPETDMDRAYMRFVLTCIEYELDTSKDEYFVLPKILESGDKFIIDGSWSVMSMISQACDIASRIYMCQFDNISDMVSIREDNHFRKLNEIRNKLDMIKSCWGLSTNAYFGIYSLKVNDNARTLWDIHQVIRNRLAYDQNPGITPENRRSKGKLTVDFDEPAHSNKNVPLIKIEKVVE